MPHVKFIDEYKAIVKYCRDNDLNLRERVMWIALFTIANERCWPDGFFTVSNNEIEGYTTFDKKAVNVERMKLKERGIIDFKPGLKKTANPQYRLRYLTVGDGLWFPHETNNTTNDTTNNTTNDTTIYKDKTRQDKTSHTHDGGPAETGNGVVAYGKFQNVFLTNDELSDLESRFGLGCHDTIERLSCYMVEKQMQYTNHYAVLYDWLYRDERRKIKSEPPPF